MVGIPAPVVQVESIDGGEKQGEHAARRVHVEPGHVPNPRRGADNRACAQRLRKRDLILQTHEEFRKREMNAGAGKSVAVESRTDGFRGTVPRRGGVDFNITEPDGSNASESAFEIARKLLGDGVKLETRR